MTMFTKSLQIGFILLGSAFLMSNLGAATPTIQGDVRGPDGKLLAGAEVRVQLKDAKAAAPAKKAKHMVWVPADTGSHLGGRWVEVDDQGKGAAGANIDKASGEGLHKKTSLTPDSTPGGR